MFAARAMKMVAEQAKKAASKAKPAQAAAPRPGGSISAAIQQAAQNAKAAPSQPKQGISGALQQMAQSAKAAAPRPKVVAAMQKVGASRPMAMKKGGAVKKTGTKATTRKK